MEFLRHLVLPIKPSRQRSRRQAHLLLAVQSRPIARQRHFTCCRSDQGGLGRGAVLGVTGLAEPQDVAGIL